MSLRGFVKVVREQYVDTAADDAVEGESSLFPVGGEIPNTVFDELFISEVTKAVFGGEVSKLLHGVGARLAELEVVVELVLDYVGKLNAALIHHGVVVGLAVIVAIENVGRVLKIRRSAFASAESLLGSFRTQLG